MVDLCRYWADGYDRRATEVRLNGLPQYLATIDDLQVHFVHVRSPHPDALPLILTNGWPGSMVKYLKVIGPLVSPGAYGGKPEDAFRVVRPTLPGYGFSGKPRHSPHGRVPGVRVRRASSPFGAECPTVAHEAEGRAPEEAFGPATQRRIVGESPSGLRQGDRGDRRYPSRSVRSAPPLWRRSRS